MYLATIPVTQPDGRRVVCCENCGIVGEPCCDADDIWLCVGCCHGTRQYDQIDVQNLPPFPHCAGHTPYVAEQSAAVPFEAASGYSVCLYDRYHSEHRAWIPCLPLNEARIMAYLWIKGREAAELDGNYVTIEPAGHDDNGIPCVGKLWIRRSLYSGQMREFLRYTREERHQMQTIREDEYSGYGGTSPGYSEACGVWN